jgi:hypothetical protein
VLALWSIKEAEARLFQIKEGAGVEVAVTARNAFPKRSARSFHSRTFEE